MQPEESVTEWIEHLKEGDENAARNIWERYFASLVHLARQHLAGVRRAAADEEDVVLNAFARFCRAIDRGRFPQLNDRPIAAGGTVDAPRQPGGRCPATSTRTA